MSWTVNPLCATLKEYKDEYKAIGNKDKAGLKKRCKTDEHLAIFQAQSLAIEESLGKSTDGIYEEPTHQCIAFNVYVNCPTDPYNIRKRRRLLLLPAHISGRNGKLAKSKAYYEGEASDDRSTRELMQQLKLRIRQWTLMAKERGLQMAAAEAANAVLKKDNAEMKIHGTSGSRYDRVVTSCHIVLDLFDDTTMVTDLQMLADLGIGVFDSFRVNDYAAKYTGKSPEAAYFDILADNLLTGEHPDDHSTAALRGQPMFPKINAGESASDQRARAIEEVRRLEPPWERKQQLIDTLPSLVKQVLDNTTRSAIGTDGGLDCITPAEFNSVGAMLAYAFTQNLEPVIEIVTVDDDPTGIYATQDLVIEFRTILKEKLDEVLTVANFYRIIKGFSFQIKSVGNHGEKCYIFKILETVISFQPKVTVLTKLALPVRLGVPPQFVGQRLMGPDDSVSVQIGSGTEFNSSLAGVGKGGLNLLKGGAKLRFALHVRLSIQIGSDISTLMHMITGGYGVDHKLKGSPTEREEQAQMNDTRTLFGSWFASILHYLSQSAPEMRSHCGKEMLVKLLLHLVIGKSIKDGKKGFSHDSKAKVTPFSSLIGFFINEVIEGAANEADKWAGVKRRLVKDSTNVWGGKRTPVNTSGIMRGYNQFTYVINILFPEIQTCPTLEAFILKYTPKVPTGMQWGHLINDAKELVNEIVASA